MKKVLSLILVLMMSVLALTACGGSGSDESGSDDAVSVDSLKTIGDIIALDSDDEQYVVYEDKVIYAFRLGETYYRANAAISAEASKAYSDIDFSDEDYEEQQKELLSLLEITEIEDLSDQMLTQEQMDALVGKTGQELQDEGWLFSGHDLENMEFWMNYGPFLYTVVFDGSVDEADYDSFEDESGTKDLTVKSVSLDALGDATSIEE
jgi:hypothetical protein